MQNYWNRRFAKEGRIWGNSPSRTAFQAMELFRKEGVRKILDPRIRLRTAYRFFRRGRIDRSRYRGLRRRRRPLRLPESAWSLLSGVRCSTCLSAMISMTPSIASTCSTFSAPPTASTFIGKCAAQVRPGGVSFSPFFPSREPTYGKGQKVEENTYESKPGRPTHYFTEADLKDHFSAFEILETGLSGG